MKNSQEMSKHPKGAFRARKTFVAKYQQIEGGTLRRHFKNFRKSDNAKN